MSTATLTAPLESRLSTPRKFTADELLTMPDGDQYELVDGELRETAMSLESSHIAIVVAYRLCSFLEAHPLGRVFGEAATYRCFPDDADQVRKPDVSFIRHGRITPDQFEHGHCTIAPDLAVEVMSPNDLYQELMRKLEDYFSAGIPLIWVVEPSARMVTVYEDAGRRTQLLRMGQELTGGDVLPGFVLPLAQLFPETPVTAASSV